MKNSTHHKSQVFERRFLKLSLVAFAVGFTTVGYFTSQALAEQPQLRSVSSQSLSQAPSTNPSPSPIPLKSEQGIDYLPLQNLLRAGKWSEANQLTSVLVLRAAKQEKQGYLTAKDIRNLSCADLRTVNRLWTYYSHDRFGFSQQAKIWRQLKGNTYEDSLRFEKQVGWDGSSSKLIPNPMTAPKGYLPLRPAGKTGIMNAFGGWWIREMPTRLTQCGIQ
jgi:hypothetical protein